MSTVYVCGIQNTTPRSVDVEKLGPCRSEVGFGLGKAKARSSEYSAFNEESSQ